MMIKELGSYVYSSLPNVSDGGKMYARMKELERAAKAIAGVAVLY